MGREIPLYGLCFFGGILFAALVGALICQRKKICRFDFVCSAVYTCIGALIGAKLLFLIVSCRELITRQIPLEAAIKGGFVFYGGLIGGVIGLWLYVREFHLSPSDFFNLYAVCLPLGHACGRVGCFLGGCCYGIPYDGPLHYVYKESAGNTPLGVPLLPIQLIEAGLLLIVFIVLLFLFCKKKSESLPFALIYLLVYAVIRFLLEFFRYDSERGHLLVFSTSQWISLILFGFSLILLIRQKQKSRDVRESFP